MEKKLALIDAQNNRVKSVIVVDEINDEVIENYSTKDLYAVEVKNNETVYVNGFYDGKTFFQPDVDYLIEIGVYPSKEELARIKKEEEKIAAQLKTEEEAIG